MDSQIQERINRAKELLGTVRHAAMATVNEDGSPHNTPYKFLIDDTLENLYWGSHLDSQHSLNVTRTGQIFVVLYEANASGGLYIQAEQAQELSGDELSIALAVHNGYRAREGKDPIPPAYYSEGLERMYGAKAISYWVNLSETNDAGLILRDFRHEISREQLL